MDSVSAADPFERIQLAMPPRDFLASILEKYDLRVLKSYKTLEKGIVELNVRACTSKGNYVIKVFSNKELQRVKDIVFSQEILRKKGVPFPEIYRAKEGAPYFTAYPDNENPYYGCVTEWLEGSDFTGKIPSASDLKKIAKYLAMINATKLKVTQIYDDCFPINLPKEYKRRKDSVEPDAQPLIEEIIQEMKNVDMAKLKYGTIHGDLSWEHVLKNEKGELGLLDLGALNISPVAFDLAYALSYYCINPKNPFNSDFKENYSTMLNEYLKHVKLSGYDIEYLPLVVKASWAHDYVIGRSHKEIFRDKIWFTPERLGYLLKQEFPELK